MSSLNSLTASLNSGDSMVSLQDIHSSNPARNGESRRSIVADLRATETNNVFYIDRRTLDNPPKTHSNAIRTARYTWYTWLPLSFYLQFHRLANIYFVIVGVLSVTPLVKGQATKTAVVAAVMFLQALKDLYEDLKRKRDDRRENERECRVFDWSNDVLDFQDCLWKDCKRSSIVKVKRGEKFPADLLVISTSDSSGEFCVSTASLDGETNLKQRSVPRAIMDIFPERDSRTSSRFLKQIKSSINIRLDPAEVNLHTMGGTIRLGEGNPAPLDAENFALRGCELRNVAWVMGIACHVGKWTKIQMNSSTCSGKQSHLEHHLNKSVLGILIAILSVSVLFALVNKRLTDNDSFIGIVFLKYLVMLWAVLPVTLYIIFESLHLIFGWFIDNDKDMMDEQSHEFARARNTSGIEDLGQVSYVFSDKTGTLTANEMRFAYCYVAGKKLGPFLPTAQHWDSNDEEAFKDVPAFKEVHNILHGERQSSQEMVMRCFRMLAICHNVKLERDDDAGDSQISAAADKLQAESPDELALVLAARRAGISWSGRERRAGEPGYENILEIRPYGLDSDEVDRPNVLYEVPFSSDRKRMSVIIHQSDGSALVYTKGSDSVMIERLESDMPRDAEEALTSFALQGLRTLVLGYKCVERETFETWELQRNAASSIESKQDREAQLELLYDIVEKDLNFVGITAVEDRLQDEVPNTIAMLRAAGVRVWVLTGDKVETAVEIAKACKLFECEPDQDHYLISHADVEDHKREIQDKLEVASESTKPMSLRGLVLDGRAVSTILSDTDLRKALCGLASKCISCVCCRLSPLQKRQLVEMVREENSSLITLAIGDGANDVPMIQGAHIGIGIRGKEGSASVLASDIAISQFRYLQSLMFIHGRKAYRRLALFLGYFMYKSMALGWAYIVNGFWENFNGDVPYAGLVDATYAPLTSWSVAFVLAFDTDDGDEVSDDGHRCLALTDPLRFYSDGPKNLGFNVYLFTKWILTATVHGLTVWLVCVRSVASREEIHSDTRVFWIASFNAFTCLLIVVHVRLWFVSHMRMFRGRTWVEKLGGMALVAELLAYFVGFALFSLLLQAFPEPRHGGGPLAPGCEDCTDDNLQKTADNSYVNVPVPLEAIRYWQFWVCNIAIPLALLVFDIVMRHTKECLRGKYPESLIRYYV